MADITPGWGTQWEALANALNDYYGGGIESAQYQQVVQMLNSGEYTMSEMESILGSIPEFQRTYNANGQLTSVSYKANVTTTTAAETAANAINSNVANGANAEFSTVQTITKNQQTGKVTIGNEVVKYSSGYAGVGKVTLGSTLAALAAVSSGIVLGKTIDSTLYNLNPDFWDENGMSHLNPETWNSITDGDDSLLADLFNFIFDLDPDTGNPQAYIDETAFAYMVAYMADQGVFADEYTPSPSIDASITMTGTGVYAGTISTTQYANNASKVIIESAGGYLYGDHIERMALSGTDVPEKFADYYIVSKDNNDHITATGVWPYNVDMTHYNGVKFYDASGHHTGGGNIDGDALVTYNGQTHCLRSSPTISASLYPGLESISGVNDDVLLAAITYNTIETSSIQGITNEPGSRQFSTAGISDYSDIESVLAALQAQYPELWDNRIEVSPDGETTHVYIPVGFPTGGTGNQPTSQGATQQNTAPDISGEGDNATDELIKTLLEIIEGVNPSGGMDSNTDTPVEPADPNEPGTGTGITPGFVLPTGSASALYSIYNPTQAQLNSLGAWLWSSNFVDQLLKVFNDPMQAIIGLHKVFATPPTSGTGNIKVGYLDSGVSSKLVSAQYTEVDCGSVSLKEYFKNALDYTQTDIYLYLPFIGIVPLNVEDVMRASINVKYKVDVLTGACLASVYVTRDAGSGGQLYTYAGNCAVQYPLSSGSYIGILAGALGIAGSVASTILSGGAALPMALGAGAAALSSAKTKVEHSGSLSGNAGAMGIKKPYLIVRRPQTKIAANFHEFNGESNNIYGALSGFPGYTRVKYINPEGIPATGDELAEIERILKGGVLI